MSRKSGDQGVRGKDEYIKAHQHKYNTRMMSCLLGVARSGYYDWLRKPESDRELEDKRLLRLIRASFAKNRDVILHYSAGVGSARLAGYALRARNEV